MYLEHISTVLDAEYTSRSQVVPFTIHLPFFNSSSLALRDNDLTSTSLISFRYFFFGQITLRTLT